MKIIKKIWRRFYDRYVGNDHLIDIRNEAYGYEGGYIDRDEAVFLACFSILTDFVELEERFQHQFDSEFAPHKEIMDLYDWWTRDRASEHMDSSRTYRELEQRDDEMFDRLMKIRRYLWT